LAESGIAGLRDPLIGCAMIPGRFDRGGEATEIDAHRRAVPSDSWERCARMLHAPGIAETGYVHKRLPSH
jgi:hypothetical protein